MSSFYLQTGPPFFVIGNPRSGTTLLRFMLNSHPRLYLPEETGFLPFLQQDPDGDLTQEQVEAVLERIGHLNLYWNNMVSDLNSFYCSLPGHRLGDVLDVLYRQKMSEYGGTRWGDKTPGYVRYIPTLSRIFPNGQFIHLIRDGRDVTLSAQAKWGIDRRYMDNYYLLKNWVKNVEDGRRAGIILGSDRYLEVRYEDLVQTPEFVLEQVCQFLGEEMQPEMLDHSRTARRHHGPDVPDEVQKPISTSSIARWQKEMSSFDQKLANRLARPLLTDLGYPLSEVGAFNIAEFGRYLALGMKFRLVDGVRRILYAAGFLSLNRGRRRSLKLENNNHA